MQMHATFIRANYQPLHRVIPNKKKGECQFQVNVQKCISLVELVRIVPSFRSFEHIYIYISKLKCFTKLNL